MKFIHRLGFYLGGFAMGLVILAFFFNGKKTSCAYGMDARVLKNIRIKERQYSPEALSQLQNLQIDTSKITYILHNGNIDFGRSDTNTTPCKTYLVTGKVDAEKLELVFENCDSTATLQQVRRK